MMGVAPWQMSLLVPAESGEVMGPGIASTSLLAERASSAVEKVPEPNPASVISVAFDSAAIRRFRMRNI